MAKRRCFGFTLIELLVVISIIALLLAILMPALNKAKELGYQIPCMANLRSLSIGFFAYQSDNGGNLISSYTWLGDIDSGRRPDAWVYPPTDMERGDPYTGENINLTVPDVCTIEREIRGIKYGKMWPYIMNEKVYHCPADKIAKLHNVGYRSYSMISTIRDPYWGVTEAQTVKKMGDINTPSSKYILVEVNRMWHEGPYAGRYHWNMGSYVFSIAEENFRENPSKWHVDGVDLAFADGHSEKYKWRSKEVKDWLNGDPVDPEAPPEVKGTVDALYFLRNIPRGDLK